ncbi:MAG TPA: hypothetical protein VF469_15750 [Kofleriaceae bacterium]
MAGLWHIEVLDKARDWVTVEVRQAHPDAGAFPESRRFALRLLHEQAWQFDSGFNYQAIAPLGQACDSRQVLDEAWLDANIDRFIAEMVPQDTTGTPLDEATAVRLVADQLGLGDLDQATEEERDRFDDAYHELWNDPSRLPARRYRIKVTDPAFLSHLVPGARWSSSAF